MDKNKLVKMVELQNFARLGETADVSDFSCDGDVFEYLLLIVLLEVGKGSPFLVWDIWKARENGTLDINIAFQRICKSPHDTSLIRLLKKYYFEDSSVIPEDTAVFGDSALASSVGEMCEY